MKEVESKKEKSKEASESNEYPGKLGSVEHILSRYHSKRKSLGDEKDICIYYRSRVPHPHPIILSPRGPSPVHSYPHLIMPVRVFLPLVYRHGCGVGKKIQRPRAPPNKEVSRVDAQEVAVGILQSRMHGIIEGNGAA